MHEKRPRDIRNLVRSTFDQLTPSQDGTISERLLIRDGHYCGHRYQRSGMIAVWFLEEEQIKFYGQNGSVVKVLSGDQSTGCETRRAA